MMQLAVNGAFGAAVTDKIDESLVGTVTETIKSTLSEAVTTKISETTASTVKVSDATDEVKVVFTTIVPSKNCDDVKCPTVPKHYEELGCEAVKDEGDCCASR